MGDLERIFTVGVYGKSASEFFAALESAEVDLFCDIRLRRGVRGAEYSFVNSNRLQAELAKRNIAYRHLQELAPAPQIRELQYAEDAVAGVAKRLREELGETFKQQYMSQILDRFDDAAFRASITGVRRVAFFCVERAPAACHRSLVAARLASNWSVPVEHL